jgi:hypothetical protein
MDSKSDHISSPNLQRAPLVRVTPKRWTPGDPLPKFLDPNAYEALRRNAEAAERISEIRKVA